MKRKSNPGCRLDLEDYDQRNVRLCRYSHSYNKKLERLTIRETDPDILTKIARIFASNRSVRRYIDRLLKGVKNEFLS